ncbi:hypothetical protein BC834DRAFT_845324 [Gloeopeniophorella convolvens]|nr:hypothetical protein BC834DRAFT_845324 [Gloeopeniophorella convolvens]
MASYPQHYTFYSDAPQITSYVGDDRANSERVRDELVALRTNIGGLHAYAQENSRRLDAVEDGMKDNRAKLEQLDLLIAEVRDGIAERQRRREEYTRDGERASQRDATVARMQAELDYKRRLYAENEVVLAAALVQVNTLRAARGLPPFCPTDDQ